MTYYYSNSYYQTRYENLCLKQKRNAQVAKKLKTQIDFNQVNTTLLQNTSHIAYFEIYQKMDIKEVRKQILLKSMRVQLLLFIGLICLDLFREKKKTLLTLLLVLVIFVTFSFIQ